MSKTKIKLALRAWKKATKESHWDKQYPTHKRSVIRHGLQQPFTSKKDWKKFCRSMAAISVSVIEKDDMIEPYKNQEHDDDSIKDELDCW